MMNSFFQLEKFNFDNIAINKNKQWKENQIENADLMKKNESKLVNNSERSNGEEVWKQSMRSSSNEENRKKVLNNEI